MEIIIHRVNTVKKLKEIPLIYGTEIDIRTFGSKLILNHEPFQEGELFEDYLNEYRHGTLILNVKEAGFEDQILRMVRMHPQIKSYFLLDVEFPYLYRASQKGEHSISVRYSEVESIETVNNFIGKVDWVWIDTNTKLPIDDTNVNVLNQFKKCLVCPERWGQPNKIFAYRKKLISLNFELDAVMTSEKFSNHWQKN